MKMNHRADRLRRERARRLLLKQMSGVSSYSDGSQILEGETLSRKRLGVLCSLINARAGSFSTTPAAQYAWHNFIVMWGMKIRGRQADADMPLKTVMLRALRDSAGFKDSGSEKRTLIARRYLRRHHRQDFDLLPVLMKCSDYKEKDFYLRSIAERKRFVLKKDYAYFKKGHPVEMRPDGSGFRLFYHAPNGLSGTVDVADPHEYVEMRRKRRRQTRPGINPGPASRPSVSAPV